MANGRRRLFLAAQVVLAVVVVAFAAARIAREWTAFRASGLHVDLRWGPIVLSCLIVFATYAILVETWRRTVAAWASSISFGAAARVWFVSNLGRYLPGKVWAIAGMAILAEREGVSGEAASGSSILINLVNVLAGFGVVIATGARVLELRAAAVAGIALLAIAVAAAPVLTPYLIRLASIIRRKPLELRALPHSAIWIAAVGCAVSWVLYGIAFRWLAVGVLGAAPGNAQSYIAVFTGSYLIGFLVLFAPGGLGVREGVMLVAIANLGLLSAPQAALLAVASRLWLTVLEVLPGVFFLVAGRALRPSPRSTAGHAPS